MVCSSIINQQTESICKVDVAVNSHVAIAVTAIRNNQCFSYAYFMRNLFATQISQHVFGFLTMIIFNVSFVFNIL